MSYNITDVINAAISLIKNIPILTDDPERYKAYLNMELSHIPSRS